MSYLRYIVQEIFPLHILLSFRFDPVSVLFLLSGAAKKLCFIWFFAQFIHFLFLQESCLKNSNNNLIQNWMISHPNLYFSIWVYLLWFCFKVCWVFRCGFRFQLLFQCWKRTFINQLLILYRLQTKWHH